MSGPRAGIGFDAHAFAPEGSGRRLVLGGVEFRGERGLAGHSDADVLLHALIDALLGAAALGDIGALFPPADPRYRDADSRDLLRQAAAAVRAQGLAVANVDATVIAERPHIAPKLTEMRTAIAGALGIDIARVSVKATTTDGLGFTGRGEGIAALAVALLE